MTDTFFEPHPCIPLFQLHVKECCAGIVKVAFLTTPLTMGQTIVQIVKWQVTDYHYIYPMLIHVSAIFLEGYWLIFCQANPLTASVSHKLAYQSIWIITVIREMYFEGGTSSFVHHFRKYVHFFIVPLCTAK